jgi:4-amino-4-deoxy-L-arabinose transferase-like glycosyltransferase
LPIPNQLRRVVTPLLLAPAVFLCFFAGLGSFGLVGPDEPRYASIAREMARSGDWVTPRLNGVPWLEKPPLYYWSAGAGFRLFSSPEVAARAPCGFYALIALLGIVLLARRFYGPDVARAAAFLLPASVAMTGFAHAAATDMPFAACLTLAMLAAAILLLDDNPAHARAWTAAFGAALGLAVLAKGPAAVALAGGSTALWAIATGNFRKVWRLCRPGATLVFAAVAVPWYALCGAQNPSFLRVFLLEHNVERFLSNRYQHQQPLWFFLPILLVAAFPWTLLLVPAIADGWRALRGATWRQSPGAFLAAWVVFPLLFFSASQSKLPGYILPAVPPCLLLLARTLVCDPNAAATGRPTRFLWVSSVLMAVGLAPAVYALAASGSLLARAIPTAPNLSLTSLGIVLFIGGVGVAAAGQLQAPWKSAAIASGVFAVSVGLAAYTLLPALGPEISPRELAFEARDNAARGAIAVYDLPRAWQYGAEFYLEGPLPEWSSSLPAPVWTITTDHGLLELARRGLHFHAVKPFYGRQLLIRVE